jgi:hypothetical protein
MKNFKKFLLIVFCNVLLITNLNSKEVPDSFADLVEKLIPICCKYFCNTCNRDKTSKSISISISSRTSI